MNFVSLKILNTDSKGEILKSEYKKIGGKYSFREIINLGGIGSDKIIYHSGIDYFDLVDRESSSEINFVNFEIAKNGLILHSNCNQRQSNCTILFSDLRRIKLLKRYGELDSFVKSNLQILTRDGHQITFNVPARSTNSIELYFNKSVFLGLFTIAVLTQ